MARRSRDGGIVKIKVTQNNPSVNFVDSSLYTREPLLHRLPLRIVGSGFGPILSQRERRDGARWAPPFGGGHPRAMLAPDASVGKAEKLESEMIEKYYD